MSKGRLYVDRPRKGDLWLVEVSEVKIRADYINQFLNIDCLEGMKLLPDSSVDMVLCDLPYGTTQCHWDILIPFDELWVQYKRITKPNAAIVLFSAQPFTTDLIMSNRKMFRYEIIWEKALAVGFLNAKKAPLRAHENICVFYRKLPTYNPIKSSVADDDIGHKGYLGRVRKNSGSAEQYAEFRKDTYEYVETGKRYPRDVIRFPRCGGAEFAPIHPTQKPVALCEYLVRTYSNEGDVILDNCAGSGTTGVASINTKRNYILMEKDREIYKAGLDRIHSVNAPKQ